jgi:hypothetical protein
MTPEEFKKRADAEWAKVLPAKLEGVKPPKPLERLQNYAREVESEAKSQGESMSDIVPCPCGFPDADAVHSCIDQPIQGEFKPGQTVWKKGTSKQPFTVSKWSDEDTLVLINPEGFIQAVDQELFTATDPNAEPTPQKCPFCGSEATVIGDEDDRVLCMAYCVMKAECGLEGPFRKTRLEAIQAWNSIRLANQPFNQEELEELAKLDRRADSEPLTEEWLRNVGLIDGIECDWDDVVAMKLREPGPGFMLYFFNRKPHEIRHYHDAKGLKTIGDARTLCRLLGVTIKE